MDKFKQGFVFCFFLISGIVLGAYLAYICDGKPYVGWMSWGKDMGVENFALDLYLIKFNLGLMVHATLSQIVSISLALILYVAVRKKR